MELQTATVLFFLLPFIIIFIFFFFFKPVDKPIIRRSKLAPGPWKLPLIGNMHQLVGAATHRALRDLARKHGPIMHLKLGEIPAIVISSPRLAKEVLKTHDLAFADRPQCLVSKIMFFNQADIAFSPYGDCWRQMRRICIVELLGPKSIRSFQFIREEEVWKLVESVQYSLGSAVNVTEKLLSTAISITFRTAFGKRFKGDRELMNLLKEAVSWVGAFDVSDLFPSLKLLHPLSRMKPKLEKMRHEMGRIIQELIVERRDSRASSNGREENGGSCEGNILDVLIRLQDSGSDLDLPITDDNIHGVILDVFLAGADTTAITIEWAISEMIRNPKVMERAVAELRLALKGKNRVHESDIKGLSYLKMVIKETLRLHPPAPLLLPRECREAREIDGFAVPIKTHLLINAWAIGTDPEYWQDPESFIPERFENSSFDFIGNEYEYIPFGAGRRACPGMSYGLANVELALAQLLHHFNWVLPYGMKPEDLDMTETSGAAAKRRNDLYLIPTQCND
ncbi:cytochrome P450 CYP71D312-like [Diospyros lotus]|uniref:cytochrome P450 CYP71D312-like n=1 Tax=Diospyros lotus TaxID=55363 RepID=UPI00224F056E|nr:cytochrome P450 CYP71D312-like [Diospyros lotus]